MELARTDWEPSIYILRYTPSYVNDDSDKDAQVGNCYAESITWALTKKSCAEPFMIVHLASDQKLKNWPSCVSRVTFSNGARPRRRRHDQVLPLGPCRT